MEASCATDEAEETQRLRALRRYDILDTPSEDAFDRITALTARLFDAPICLIALVDESRVWFKSRQGFSEAEIVRELSLCSRVAEAEGLCLVEDARHDPNMADHPLVSGDFALRFYAAAPLRTPEGYVLGALCVIDHQPRTLGETEKANLRDLAGMVMDELEMRRQARHRFEEDAQFNEERYRELFELNPQPMWVFDAETLQYLAVNEAAIRHYGYSREEFMSMTAASLRPPEDMPDFLASLAEKRHEVLRESWRHRKKDGSIIDVEITSRDIRMSGRPARLVMAYDTSERSQSKRDLQLRDRYLAALVTIQRELLKQPEVSGCLDHMLHLLGEISGASRVYYLEEGRDALSRPVVGMRAKWQTPDAPPVSDENARWRALADRPNPEREKQLRSGETLFLAVDELPENKRAIFESCGVKAALFAPLLAGGRFYGALAFEHCTSAQPWSQAEADHLQAAAASLAMALEREASARALADEKERLSVTLASLTEGVITTDLHGHVVLMNRVAEDLTGWTTAEALGRPVQEIFTAYGGNSFQEGQPLADSVAQVLATGRTVERGHQVWLHSREGVARRIAKSSAPVYDERGHIIGAVRVFRDITAQEKIAEELLKASKLESIGILAGGIAHDFNNILTAIIGNLSLAKTYSGANDRAVGKLEAAERACFRARDLTNQLLTFAKGGAPIKKLSRLEEVVRDSIGFALHGSTVHCRFALADDLWPVEVDVGQLSQVLNNLAINAVQAMPKGGFIDVQAENLTLVEPRDLPSLGPGNYVKISVEDDGVGIAAEHMNKIFDPFFSTKQNGSGLGLATSYSIIKKHGGHISVDSVRGVGSVFRLYLPAVLRTPEAEPPAAPPGALGKGSRVLVMDDEASVRELAQAMLTHLGCEMAAAPHGVAAVESYRQAREEGRPFDAVILDLTVPGGMGGEQTLGLLRQIDPEVKAIVSSGYSNNPIMSHYRERGFSGVLTKPYHLDEMAAALNGLLSPATRPGKAEQTHLKALSS